MWMLKRVGKALGLGGQDQPTDQEQVEVEVAPNASMPVSEAEKDAEEGAEDETSHINRAQFSQVSGAESVLTEEDMCKVLDKALGEVAVQNLLAAVKEHASDVEGARDIPEEQTKGNLLSNLMALRLKAGGGVCELVAWMLHKVRHMMICLQEKARTSDVDDGMQQILAQDGIENAARTVKLRNVIPALLKAKNDFPTRRDESPIQQALNPPLSPAPNRSPLAESGGLKRGADENASEIAVECEGSAARCSEKRRRIDTHNADARRAEGSAAVLLQGQEAELVPASADMHGKEMGEGLPGDESEDLSGCRRCIAETWNQIKQEEPPEEPSAIVGMSRSKSSLSDVHEDDDDGDIDLDLSGMNLKETSNKIDLCLLASHVRASWPVLEHVKDSDVIMLLGNTGVGKSLLIQAIAGRELVPIKKPGFRDKIAWEVKNPVEGFKVGHRQSSKTKCFRHFARGSLVYLDTPGYSDSAGQEVDLTTTVVAGQVASLCKRMRFVVLIDCYAFLPDKGKIMKEVVKLVLSYVSTFNCNQEHQRAFTFLFTKTDALGDDAAQDAGVAREKLRECLRETSKSMVHSTQEERLVFQHLHNSLRQPLEFGVDVFNPQFSEVEHLRQIIESFERHDSNGPRANAIQSPGNVIRTGMPGTLQAQLKLDLQDLVENLGLALNCSKFLQAQRLLDTVQFLHEHLAGKPFVSEQYAKAMQCLESYAKQAGQQIFQHMQQGTIRQRGPAPTHTFSVREGREVLRLIAVLKVLARHAGAAHDHGEEALKILDEGRSQMLQLVQEAFTVGATFGPEGYSEEALRQQHRARTLGLRALETLRVWRDVHTDFAREADVAEQTVQAGVQQAAALAAGLVQRGSVPDAPELVFAIVHLSHLNASTGASSSDGLVADVLTKCVHHMETIIRGVANEAVAHDGAEEEGFRLIGSADREKFRVSIQRLEHVCSLLAVPQLDTSMTKLATLARDSRRSVLTATKAYFQKLLHEVERAGGSLADARGSGADQNLQQLLDTTKALEASLSPAQHEECGSSELYTTAVAYADREVRQLCEQAESLKQLLVRADAVDGPSAEPGDHAAKLQQLADVTWLDLHLQACRQDPYINKKITDLRADYTSFCKSKREAACASLESYFHAGGSERQPNSEEHARCFQEAARTIQHVGRIGDGCGAAEHVAGFKQDVSASVELWRSSVQGQGIGKLAFGAEPSERDKLAKVVNHVLGVSEALNGAEMVELASSVADLLSPLLAALNTAAATERDRDKCLAFLALQRWKELGLTRLLEQLPDANGLRAKIENSIEVATQAAQSAVEHDEGSAHEAISELRRLAEAYKELDWQSAGSTASLLHENLQLRSSKLEESLQKGLKEGRFSGVREYMETRQSKKDKLSREQVDSVMHLAHEVLKEKAAAARKDVGNGCAVVNAVKALQDASEHVGEQLIDKYSYNAGDVASKLRGEATAHLEKLGQDLRAAMTSRNFEQIFRLAPVIKAYIDATIDILVIEHSQAAARKRRKEASDDIRERTKQLLVRAAGSLKEVDEKIDSFRENVKRMREGDTDIASADLCSVLRSLQVAARAGNLVDLSETKTPLADRYEAVRQRLSSLLSEVLQETKNKAHQDNLFAMAIKIWSSVNREMQHGLKAHVSLDIDFDNELQQLQKQQNDAHLDLKNKCHSIEHITKEWQPTLDRLKACNEGWLAFWYNSTYQNQKSLFIDEVNRMFQTVTGALQQQNYFPARPSAAVLQHVCCSTALKAHLDDSVFRKWERVCTLAAKCFKQDCKKITAAIKNNDVLSFNVCFRRVHEFEICFADLELSPLLKHDAQDVHRAILEWVETRVYGLNKQLDGNDFVGAVSAVTLLRDFGKVLLSTLALYMDMAEADQRHRDSLALAELKGCLERHFSFEAAKVLGVHFGILELDPTASTQDVKTAHKTASLKHHPDKRGDSAMSTAMQQRINSAKQELLEAANRNKFHDLVFGRKAPFASKIQAVLNELRGRVKTLLEAQDYDKVSDVLRHLDAVSQLAKLASMDNGAKTYCDVISKAVKEHTRSIHQDVDTLFRKREYRQLNEKLIAARKAEDALSAYDESSSGWYRKIQQSVEDEIERIASIARKHVVNKARVDAFACIGEFAMQLLLLGRIYDDLSHFQDMCKQKISRLLDLCNTSSNWGCSYTFRLGMLLGQGEVGDKDKDGKVSSEDDRIGKHIVAEFKQFKDVNTWVWNSEVVQMDVAHVAGAARAWSFPDTNRRDVPLDKVKLVDGFQQYEAEYKKRFDQWSADRLKPEKLAQDAVELATKIQPQSTDDWSEELKSQLPTLVAYVFCYLAIEKSGESFKRIGADNDRAGDGDVKIEHVLFKPHCAQVLTVLQMLGYGGSSYRLQNQLMQIRTGEGKSLILGACSVVLALLGFRVCCVCYSEYLSKRDYNLFQKIFDAFNVRDWVKYSTIKQYAEDCIKHKGPIRELTKALLLGENMDVDSNSETQPRARTDHLLKDSGDRNDSQQAGQKRARTVVQTDSSHKTPKKAPRSGKGGSASMAKASSADSAPEILLVDEVDVFFGEDFYGKTHNQGVQIDEPEAVELLREVWRLYKAGSKHPDQRDRLLEDVQRSAAYSAVLDRFSKWHSIIEQELAMMCSDVFVFKDHSPSYDKDLDRLGYKVMDTYDYSSAVYGYKTAFAYLDWADNNGFINPEEALEHALKLSVRCSSFSYANINPDCILGVSGTLTALGDFEIEVMKKYNINLFSSMPSVYGTSQFSFDECGDGIIITSDETDFHLRITEEVNRITSGDRAVIVFFESPAHLRKYLQSTQFHNVKRKGVLSEDLSTSERDFAINKAPTNGQATFSSAAFGRGTDFFCNDKKVIDAGGVHVIQTFLSRLQAEEIQIQGRTARQGKKGTYGMILLESDLKKDFNIESLQVAKRDLYTTLHNARISKRVKEASKINERLLEAEKLDKISHEYFDALLMGPSESKRAIACFTKTYNELRKTFLKQVLQTSVDVCFMMDCTGSMASWIAACKDKVKEISETLSAKIRQTDASGTVRFAFVGYRDYITSHVDGGYDEPQVCPFSTAEDLKRFVAGQQASGGYDGPEDVCGGLRAVSKLNWKSASRHLFIIADAPCHGSRYHDWADNYPGGDPLGDKPEDQLLSLVKSDGSVSGVKVHFIKVNTWTDQMVGLWNESLWEKCGVRVSLLDLSACTDITDGFSTVVSDAVSQDLMMHTH